MPCAVILTALPVEYLAVRAHLTNPQEITHPKGNKYEQGSFSTEGQTWNVGIAQIGEGNQRVAFEVERIIDYFKPDVILFVGVAGGVKNVTLGDVVVPNQVYGYESGAAEETFKPRPRINRPTHDLEQLAKAEAIKTDWLRRFGPSIPDPPPNVIADKPIASGESVFKSTRSDAFQFLQSYYGDTVAVEMEGFGFLEAARANQQVSAAVIRGISDLIDKKAEADKTGYQKIAAHHASAFAFELLAKFNYKSIRRIGSQSHQEERIVQYNYIGGTHIHAPQSENNYRILELQSAILSSELERVYSDLSNEIDTAKLKEIRDFEYQGLVRSAQNLTRNLRDSANWKGFTRPLQAKILRMLAWYAVTLDNDVTAARALLEQATQLDSETETTLIQTLICSRTDGIEAALIELNSLKHISHFNLKLALLLEINRADEAIATIQAIPKKLQPNADTHRLHALALLIEGNILEAQQKIQDAAAANPEWETVREVEALINYHSALSPAALQKRKFPLPDPVDRAFIKHDDDSIARLRKAEAAFGKLASETERADELRQYWRIWQLACLANDPNRQDEARAFCKTLIEENPSNTKAIIWATARNYDIDFAVSQRALEQSLGELAGGREAIELITVLLWLYLNSENFQDTLRLLEQTREQFEQQDNINYWLFWRVQALVANKRSEEALQEIETLQDPQMHRLLKTLVLREIASQSGDWQPVIEHLENCFEETQDGRFLYECCCLKDDLQDWAYIADRAEILLERIGTPGALSLSVVCSHKAKRPTQCVKLLNDNQNLFQNGILPEGLRHLKVWCLAQSGSITAAVTEAEALVQEYPNPNNLATLLAIQFRQGDTYGMVITARHLLKHEDVPPINLLQAARLVQPENLRLARQLWQQAVAEPVDPKILGEVIDVGFKLSLDSDDSKLRPFLHQAQLLSLKGQGPFQAFTLKEAISLQQSWAERANVLNQKYDRGEIPIHLIAEASQFPLVNLFRDLLRKSAVVSNPHRQPPLFVRHGGRSVQTHPLTEEFTASCSHWRLHLDITAFLLADYLKILEPLEEHFKPLKISASFLPALTHQLQMLQLHQPSRLELYRQTLELVRRGVLKELPRQLDTPTISNHYLVEKKGQQWVALLERAKTEGGYLVEFLPLISRLTDAGEPQTVTLLEEDQERVINCRNLLEALKQNSLLTDNHYRTALADLGSEGYLDPSASLPQLNVPIFLMDGTASVLAKAKILNKICQHFQVSVDYTYLEEARRAKSADEKRSEIRARLKDLIERVRDGLGLERNIYETVTLPDSTASQELKLDEESNLDLLTVFDLFRFEPQLNDDGINVIWIDDRFFNQYPHHVQIITIVEVLDALLALDILSQDNYYDKLLQLRKANTRYIPITSREIIYWLKQAPIVDGSVKETEALAVLRKYVASCLLDNHRLQLSPMPEGFPSPQDEVTFLLICLRAIEDTIVSGWLDDSVSNENAIAYANWVLFNLYTGTFGTRHLTPANDSSSHGANLIGLDISGLYIRGIQFWQERSDNNLVEQSPRQRYFTWLEGHVERQFKANPEAITTTAQAIYSLVNQQSKAPQEDELQDKVVRYIHQQFYYDLPVSLRTAIKSDPELMNWLSLQTTQLVQITSLSFPATDFWRAAEAAINGREATVASLESDIALKIQPIANNSARGIIEIRSPDDSIVQGINDALFTLLSNDQSQREEVLRSHRFWLDCENATLERIIDEIISIEDPHDRIERAKALRDQSAAFFYKKLETKLDHTNQFDVSDLMPPSAEGLVRHFRLKKTIKRSDDFHANLRQAAQSLISEEGIEEALNRLACLPVKLPSVVSEELSKLTSENRQILFKKFADSWIAPVYKFHLIDLTLSFSQELEIELAKHLLDEIYSDVAIPHFNLFSVLLQLVDNAFSFRNDVKEWSVPIRLAMTWAHANKLQNFLDVPNLKLGEFIDILWEFVKSQVNPDRLNRNPELWNDVLHPHRFDPTVLVVHGLASLLQNKSLEVLNRASVIEQIQTFAVKTVEDHRLPNPQLFRDPVLASDSLGSILGGDRGFCLAPFFGSELAQYLESASLKSIIEGAIQNLESDPTDLAQWSWLNAVVGDLPIYEDLRDSFKHIFEEINIAALFKINSDLALKALDIASNQVNHIDDGSVRAHLENQLLSLVRLLAEQEVQENADENVADENVVVQLIETIFKLSIRPESPLETSQSMADLMIRAVNIWQKLADSHIYSGLFKLIQELPTEQLNGFWKAFLHLRALRSQQI